METNTIKTTGQLRALLARAAQDVLSGELAIDKAGALHKLAKNISDSLYSETKIAIFTNGIGGEVPKMGELKIGE